MKVSIGSLYNPRPSMFSRRDADGSFAHTLPPMTAVDEQLQQALIRHELDDPTHHPADRWIALLAYAGVAGLTLAWILAQVLP